MTQAATDLDVDIDARLRDVLAVHFDPRWGTPYWLERRGKLGFDPRAEIASLADLSRFGLMEPAELGRRPLEAFIPRSLLEQRDHLIVAQTGGTTGRPVWTAYLEDEFHAAFVEPFLVAAGHVGFPRGGAWLYVGPTGPHVIAKAARAIARGCGCAMPFSVDFDARWAKRLAPGSFAAQRYLGHVVEQAICVIRSQPVTVLFTTPAVLRALAEVMTPAQRGRIHGVHYGGMAIAAEEMEQFQTAVFPEAVHLAGYGNTLFGCCLELSVSPGRPLRYYPYGNRLVFGVVKGLENSPRRQPGVLDEAKVTTQTDQSSQNRQSLSSDGLNRSVQAINRLDGPPLPGVGDGSRNYSIIGKPSPEIAEGRLVFTRLDRTMLLVNVLERDHVRLVRPPSDAPAGFSLCGVEAPSPVREARIGPALGLY